MAENSQKTASEYRPTRCCMCGHRVVGPAMVWAKTGPSGNPIQTDLVAHKECARPSGPVGIAIDKNNALLGALREDA